MFEVPLFSYVKIPPRFVSQTVGNVFSPLNYMLRIFIRDFLLSPFKCISFRTQLIISTSIHSLQTVFSSLSSEHHKRPNHLLAMSIRSVFV
jgi:hypothetical protein